MTELIEVFKITEISPKARAKIIIRLGKAINHKYASNVTEPLVYELVSILDPSNELLQNETFKRLAGVTPNN